MIPYFTFPTLQLGPLTLHLFPLFLLAGFGLGTMAATVAAWRSGRKWWLMPVVAVVAGAALIPSHLVSVALMPDLYAENPAWVFQVWRSQWTPAWFAAFGLGIAVLLLVDRQYYRDHLDHVALGFAVAWGLGRVGCFGVHDHVGVPTSMPWGVQGICPTWERYAPDVSAAACHDLALYEIGYLFFAAVVGVALIRARVRPGLFAAGLLAGFAVVRSMLEFLRFAESAHTGEAWLTVAVLAVGAGSVLALSLLLNDQQSKNRVSTPDLGAG